jgi:hypothetical protein
LIIILLKGKHMPTRTIKVCGHTTGATATFTFNGIEVFNGTVASAGTDTEAEPLFTFDISTDINGYIPGILSVSSGTMCVSVMQSNYSTWISDGVDASEMVDTYNWMNSASNTSTINRVINGYEQPDAIGNFSLNDREVSADSLPGAFPAIVTAGDVNYTADWAIDEAITS